MWNRELALTQVRLLEILASQYNAHVALTGGCLYKQGDRKDVDFLFYRHHGKKPIEVVKLLQRIEKEFHWTLQSKPRRIVKMDSEYGPVDLFFPEEFTTVDNNYDGQSDHTIQHREM